MIRGTTPTLTLKILNNTVDLTAANNVYVTIKQKNYTLTKTSAFLEIAVNTIDCYLTQEESLRLVEGAADVQVNWTYESNGTTYRAATKVKQIAITQQLLNKVIS